MSIKTKKFWFDEVREITQTLVTIPSTSPNKKDENKCANQIIRFLLSNTGLKPQRWLTDDGRYNVMCLLKANHSRNDNATIILLCHYDTVGVNEFENFGLDKTFAFDPDKLRTELLSKDSLPENVKKDLENKDWMFGRGCLDMKSGIAAHIAVMRNLWRERD